MTFNPRPLVLLSMLAWLLGVVSRFEAMSQAVAGPRCQCCWRVEDVRPGMRGHCRAALEGTGVVTFDAEVLGVLRGTGPGRDLILCRLSGPGLDRTGALAGLGGSPVRVEDKLLGTVADVRGRTGAGTDSAPAACGVVVAVQPPDVGASPEGRSRGAVGLSPFRR